MQPDDAYLFFQSKNEESVKKSIGNKATYADFLNREPLIKEGISWIEVEAGYLGRLANRENDEGLPSFVLSYFTPVWRNMGGLIRQKIEIKEDKHPVHTGGVVFSSFKVDEDIPIISRGLRNVERARGVERIYFDGTIPDAFTQYEEDLKGKIVPKKHKPLVIIWDNTAEQTAKKHGYAIEYFFDLDTLVNKRQELFIEAALNEL